MNTTIKASVKTHIHHNLPVSYQNYRVLAITRHPARGEKLMFLTDYRR